MKKNNDKPQAGALKKLLKSGFKKARNKKLANIDKVYGQQVKAILAAYEDKSGILEGNRKDNEKSANDATFGNQGNLAREGAELLAEAASQGAGETDTLKSQLMALRNWDANQAEVNRSYFDTVQGINTSLTDLNSETRTGQVNLASQMLGDKEQVWTNYYNQRTDAWTQLGNLRANPYSNAYSKKGAKSAYRNMASDGSKAWTSPGIDEATLNWEGTVKAEEGKMNNTRSDNAPKQKEQKRPEGATLRKW